MGIICIGMVLNSWLMPWSLDNHIMMHSRLVCVHNYPKLDETLITLHKFERSFEWFSLLFLSKVSVQYLMSTATLLQTL